MLPNHLPRPLCMAWPRRGDQGEGGKCTLQPLAALQKACKVEHNANEFQRAPESRQRIAVLKRRFVCKCATVSSVFVSVCVCVPCVWRIIEWSLPSMLICIERHSTAQCWHSRPHVISSRRRQSPPAYAAYTQLRRQTDCTTEPPLACRLFDLACAPARITCLEHIKQAYLPMTSLMTHTNSFEYTHAHTHAQSQRSSRAVSVFECACACY